MSTISMALALVRSVQLNRELRKVERRVADLDRNQKERLAVAMFREYEAARQSPHPHLHQTSGDIRYRPWGEATAIGCERMGSANAEVQLSGLALWIAVAYHETHESPYGAIQGVHRRLVRIARDLRQSVRKPKSRPPAQRPVAMAARA